MKKVLITILILMAILQFNIAIVTPGDTPIQARNNHGQYITLYPAKARHNKIYLLENISPGKRYIIIECKNNIFNSEDDTIILEKGL